MKIVTIIGARPQFIKAAIISRELENYKNINEIIIHTGQHYDSNMSDIFFKQMGIPYPNYNLSIGGGTHGQMTGRQIEEIENQWRLKKTSRDKMIEEFFSSYGFEKNAGKRAADEIMKHYLN